MLFQTIQHFYILLGQLFGSALGVHAGVSFVAAVVISRCAGNATGVTGDDKGDLEERIPLDIQTVAQTIFTCILTATGSTGAQRQRDSKDF